ncbi:MAG TPA: class D sortase [Candidatus Dormibacteraeota bacterium]|nr:class D sortase [Candidatus Dormibacteraeota bacterium]
MALHLRTAGWKRFHPARLRGRRAAKAILAAGATAFVAGAGILAGTLAAPMLGIGGPTVTEMGPIPISAPMTGANGLSALTDLTSRAEVAMLDRPVNGVAFHMAIPAIDYSSTVYEGVSLPTLEKGPGHYPSTAWPGHPGNVGIAAHNVYWLAFSRLKAGDTVELQTRRGLFVYRITGSKIVEPDDQSELLPSVDGRLTLTTCWPLWAGAYATKRFIFSAVAIGGVA